MMEFILKGILRDRHRSLLPVIVIALGVMLTTFMYGWLKGVIGDMMSTGAKLESGHVKVMTAEYADIASQVPNDLGIVGYDEIGRMLEERYKMQWAPRIHFGGLLDVPDDAGETLTQGPFAGIGLDLFTAGSAEIDRFDLANVLVAGQLPSSPGEILVSDELRERLSLQIGDTATYLGSTVNGSLSIQNFVVVGAVHYGIPSLDRNLVLADISDVQYALDMPGSTAELLGFFPNSAFHAERAREIQSDFIQQAVKDKAGQPLVLLLMTEQSGTMEFYSIVDYYVWILMAVMILFMGVVLWNFGLMAGLRRYGEIGVRLAMGESKGEIVRWLMYEALVIGIIGSAIGTAIGMSFCFYLQEVGWDLTEMVQGSTILMSPVFRAEVTVEGFFLGFIPGILAVLLGTGLSARGVYKRSTAALFKELET